MLELIINFYTHADTSIVHIKLFIYCFKFLFQIAMIITQNH